MEPAIKGRCLFEMSPRAPTVTFDDAKEWRRNFSWVRYAGSHWSYEEPDTIRIEIDEWMVIVSGQNLAPLFQAIRDQNLSVITARPECENDPKRANDTFATKIQSVKLAALAPPPRGRPPKQMQMPLA